MLRRVTVTFIGDQRFDVKFHGVRGSTPCQGDEIARYGGNTSCVSVDIAGHDPILLDLGTGARYFGEALSAGERFRGTCLLTHVHWDHIQGLPFFPPLLRPNGGHLDVYAPADADGTSIGDVVSNIMRPPLFPVGLDAFPGTVGFRSVADDDFMIGEIAVRSRLIPHIGNTCGFRLDWNGRSVAYLSDHQQPGVDRYELTDGARELCEGVDLLIHDAQYTTEEFARRSNWGHCTVDFAVWVATECKVGSLALYHHDPMHSDELIDRLVVSANRCATDLSVIGAAEGLIVHLGDRSACR